MITSKILTGIAALAIAAATLSVAASAVEPSYKVSDDYKDTLYYSNLQTIELTGDGATDVIAVALSQLGYHEGNSNADLDGLNTSGSKNFTEYNVLFGKLDNGEGNGTSYGYAWCAAFVNWCLRQARVEKDLTGGMYVSCNSWRNWFIREGASQGAEYHDGGEDYIPRKGDLIFFLSLTATHSRATDHIGIVLKCENGKVYTIEGNSGNCVGLHEYDLNDPYIVGYGTVAYQKADVPAVDYYANENHMPGFFIAGKGVTTAYAAPGSTADKVGKVTGGAVYRVTAVQGNYGFVTLEDGSSGWVSLKRFTPITTDASYTVELAAGEQSVQAVIAAGSSWTIPELTLTSETGDLMGWSAGEGTELYTAGQVITPAADLHLEPVYPQPTEPETTTEPETETEPQTEAESTTQAKTESEQTTESAAESNGCNGSIGAALVGLLLTVCAAFACKKK
ncbi:MAG: CHAP domain-containing protein [Clostridia bacterium]|nr:CHAP domain-containing protein [Clostridia bacterium]